VTSTTAVRHGPVTIDKAAEQAIVDRAWEGLDHTTLGTPGPADRTDFLVSNGMLETFVVEVKDRDYTYTQLAGWGGPLVDTGKAAAVAERAAEMDPPARGVVVWRTSDGWLVGASAEDILTIGVEDPRFLRKRGGRSIDHRKSVHKLDVRHCYVRPPADITAPAFMEQSWLRWLGGSSDE